VITPATENCNLNFNFAFYLFQNPIERSKLIFTNILYLLLFKKTFGNQLAYINKILFILVFKKYTKEHVYFIKRKYNRSLINIVCKVCKESAVKFFQQIEKKYVLTVEQAINYIGIVRL
jgi:hypothetical protein